jgi:hypothetical protein
MRKLFTIFKLVVLSAIILFFGCFLYIGVALHWHSYIGNSYSTWDGLLYDAHLCDKYKAQFGAWPNSLEQIQSSQIKLGNRGTKDAWGREAIFVPYDKSVGYGQVISYGRDGKPGGTGVDRDIIIRYPTEANAVWNKQQCEGLQKPPRL